MPIHLIKYIGQALLVFVTLIVYGLILGGGSFSLLTTTTFWTIFGSESLLIWIGYICLTRHVKAINYAGLFFICSGMLLVLASMFSDTFLRTTCTILDLELIRIKLSAGMWVMFAIFNVVILGIYSVVCPKKDSITTSK